MGCLFVTLYRFVFSLLLFPCFGFIMFIVYSGFVLFFGLLLWCLFFIVVL